MKLIEQCGIMLEPQEGLTAVEVVKAARTAERLGFGYLLRSDHLLPTSGRRGLSSPECWTTLGAIAASTETIGFGPLVSPIGFRNPALLARMASTVNSLSAGRLQLGVGMGWYQDEYRAFGFDFPSFRMRREQLIEGLEIIRSLFRDGAVDFKGRYFSISITAQPESRPPRLVIGGKSPSLVRAASAYADEWNILAPSKEDLTELRKHFSHDLTISQMGPFIIAEDEPKLKEKLVRRMKLLQVNLSVEEYLKRLRSRNAMIGTPAEFIEQLDERLSWGIQKFYFQTFEPQDEQSLTLLSECLKQV
ncbi:MAG: LLM class flavin-dependent oxidoreductase [Conexivisphaerales archaeon]